jgi:hypothetical protein
MRKLTLTLTKEQMEKIKKATGADVSKLRLVQPTKAEAKAALAAKPMMKKAALAAKPMMKKAALAAKPMPGKKALAAKPMPGKKALRAGPKPTPTPVPMFESVPLQDAVK